MSLSLPLRINLISLVFATLVASVLTALGGLFLHHQQSENAVYRATLAADELTLRAGKLLDLELRLADFIGFDEQRAAVIRNDPLLREAVVYDAEQRVLFRSRLQALAWPPGLAAPGDEAPAVVSTPAGTLVMRPLLHRGPVALGTVVVAVDSRAVLASTLRNVAWLVACALMLFVVGLVIQQGVFWRTVGSPLATLVRTADAIRPDDPSSLAAVRTSGSGSDDDIGRLHAAFARLMQRLMDARAQLAAHNAQLEHTVRERTLALEQANEELARDIERRKELEDELRHAACSPSAAAATCWRGLAATSSCSSSRASKTRRRPNRSRAARWPCSTNRSPSARCR